MTRWFAGALFVGSGIWIMNLPGPSAWAAEGLVSSAHVAGSKANAVSPVGFHARAPWVQTAPPPEEVYTRQCALCHGEDGQGDGPAAAAFDPRPGTWADKEFWAQRTDRQIDSVIIAGKGSMPAMGDALGPEVREALINYLREKYQDVSVRETIGS